MNEKVVKLEEVSTQLNIPLAVLQWTISQNREMKKGVHYTEEGSGVNLTLVGLLALISSKITTEYEKLIFLLEPFFEKKQDMTFLLTLKSLIDGQLSLIEYEKPECSEKPIFAYTPEEEKEDSDKDRFEATDEKVPKLSDENAIQWSVWARNNAQAYVKEKKEAGEAITFCLLLRKIYRIISEKYGVNFADAKKEFCQTYGLPLDTKVSNFRIISDSPAGRKMFDEAMQEYTTRDL